MGLLKHVVFPLFAVLHAFSIQSCMTLDGWANMVGLEVESDDDRQSVRQLHMLGVLRGFNIAVWMLCGMGMFTESAHFRGVVSVALVALHGVVAVDAYQLGIAQWYVPAALTAVALAGVVVHSMEPGIFTKDKKQKDDSTKAKKK